MPEGDSKDIFRIIRATGARPHEIFGMRWEYVSGDVYLNSKGKTPTARRAIPLFDPCMEILSNRKSESLRR
jgi:hypothetical protein